MSRVFSKNNKELANVKIITSKEAYTEHHGKFVLCNDLEFVGKVEKSVSNFVVKAYKKKGNGKVTYIEDTASLPKSTKSKLVNLLFNENKKVAYLVKNDKKQDNVKEIKGGKK